LDENDADADETLVMGIGTTETTRTAVEQAVVEGSAISKFQRRENNILFFLLWSVEIFFLILQQCQRTLCGITYFFPKTQAVMFFIG